jgi:ParB-like chromosome segregation protein Spo0J
MPAIMSAELLPIESVISNPDNPRVLKDDRYAKLKKSIEDFPEMLWKRPLVVVKAGRKKHMVLGGNARLKACVELGIAQVPVIHADDWSEEQRKQFVIKDNVSTGDWDWDVIGAWDVDSLKEWGLEVRSLEAVVDYSLLNDENDGEIEAMTRGVKKSIQIEFDNEHFEEAYELVKYWRSQNMYIGRFLVEKLKEAKQSAS